jgi:hypothetical protein
MVVWDGKDKSIAVTVIDVPPPLTGLGRFVWVVVLQRCRAYGAAAEAMTKQIHHWDSVLERCRVDGAAVEACRA